MKVFEPTYKVRRVKDSDGDLMYFVDQPNKRTRVIMKVTTGRYVLITHKPMHYPTLRDAIFEVLNQ